MSSDEFSDDIKSATRRQVMKPACLPCLGSEVWKTQFQANRTKKKGASVSWCAVQLGLLKHVD